MWDIENKKLNDRFSCIFEKVSARHRCNTRSASSNKLCTDFKENTSHGPKTFRNYGSKLWNWICDQNFYEPNLSKGLFRKRFKHFLISDYS